MSDRELLEWAAKAAGIEVIRSRLEDSAHRDLLVANSVRNPFQKYGPWNPLTDDGDSARLESALQMHVEWHPAIETVSIGTAAFNATEPYGKDRQAARRMAGVRAAASIGQQKGE